MKFRELIESIKKLSDNKIDAELKGKTVKTFKYDANLAIKLGKVTDVIITKDKKFMHVEDSSKIKELIKNLTKHLKEIK